MRRVLRLVAAGRRCGAAGRRATAPDFGGGLEAIEDLEDIVFDLRGELRALRGENERLKAELTGTTKTGGLAEAAEAVAAAIRLRSRVAELAEELEIERAEALHHRAQAAQLGRQLDEAQAERRRLALLAQALRTKLDAQTVDHGPLAPEIPFAVELRPVKRRRRPAGRTEKSLAQYALF